VELGRVAWRRGASALDLRGAAGAFRGALPPDYLAFMAGADGGEGWVGADGDYLILFPLRDLVGLNRAYQVDVFAPGLVVIGSSGGGEAFAFDTRRSPPPVVAVPWVEMTLDLAAPVAPSFAGLLAALAAGWEVPDLG
jgi:hypothetical protein